MLDEKTAEDRTPPGRTGRNVAVMLGTQVVSWVLTFLVTLYLPRYVGDVGLGKLAFASAFVALFAVFVPLGTSTVLVKEIARDRGRIGEYLCAALLLRLLIGGAMIGLVWMLAWALGYPIDTRTLVAVAAVGAVIGAVNDGLASALQGQERMSRHSLAVLVEKFLSTGLVIGLILWGGPLWSIAAVAGFAGLVSILVNLTAFSSLLRAVRWPRLTVVRGLAAAGLPFMGCLVFRNLYGQTDPVVLSLVTNDATVGWYAAAFRLLCTALFFPTAITAALLPALARLHATGSLEFQALARRMLAMVMLCAIPIALVLGCLPEQIFALLNYPPEFNASIPVLRVSSIGVVLYYAASVLGTIVIASDGQNRMLRATVAATLLGVPACFAASALGHRFWGNGAVGAMASDVLLEVFLVISYLRMLPAGTFRFESLSLIGRYILAALPMAALLTAASQSGLGLWIAVPCAGTYLALCWVLRCLDPQYLQTARAIFGRKAQV